jgi:hypothetical protein
MPLTITKTLARFEDLCAVEEALPLLAFLKGRKNAKVDLSRCTYLHSALLQLLFIGRAKIVALPADPLLARWVERLLAGRCSLHVAQPVQIAR